MRPFGPVWPGTAAGNHWTVVATVPSHASLDQVAKAAADCRACDLFENATQTVFGAGPASARVLLVGEQPGDVEDQRGAPFVGPAGRVLDRAMAEAGLSREHAYLTNAVKHFSFRPAGKRRIHETPKARHISACRPWLAAEVLAVSPELTVCMGAIAAKAVIGPDVRVLRDRGVLLERDSLIGPGTFLLTVHPSAILRAPSDRREEDYKAFVSDLRVAANALGR
ncbi:MAG: phage polymerase-related protein [Pseudonocardiales bacterium]|nr:phage polymerase-related protein [Pseudonocardiales bacterium]